MSVAKPSSSGSPNAMKSEETNYSIEPSIRQDNDQVPVIHVSGAEENMGHWFQLLHALDQPDLLGWPLMSPIKVPMQKCKKCSLEFCSPINYRRHIRVHRQSSTLNKESNRNKELLAAFWDKLTLEKADEVVSFNEVMLKEIPGLSVITALASSLCNPAVWALPQDYVRAGSSLLDMIKAKPSRLPIASQELFCILDEASERTFLCGGTPESVQNYLFDGEATKTCLQLKNLVASTSFLFEQQLVKAWAAEKDTEALRCQKLLVEEEEAAKKRLAELSERKKQKKLRRKEHKLKELSHQSERDLNAAVDTAERPVLAQVSEPLSPPYSSSNLIHGLENLESDLESPPNQEKGLEAITRGDTETTESRMVVESNSICAPENLDTETTESGMVVESNSTCVPEEKDLARQIDLSDEGICQRDSETIESQMACESNSVHRPENCDAGLESLQNPERDSVSSGGLKPEETETIEPQMAFESNPIYGLENHEKDVVEQNDFSSRGIFQGDTDTIPSYMVCESNEETGKFYSLTPLNRNTVSKKKDETKCGCDHLIEETNFEVLIGSISIKVNLPAFLVGDVVVSEKAGAPIIFCDGGTPAPVPTPYDHCDHAPSNNRQQERINHDRAPSNNRQQERINHNHAPSNNRQQERITITPASIAAAKEFLARRWRAALASKHVVY